LNEFDEGEGKLKACNHKTISEEKRAVIVIFTNKRSFHMLCVYVYSFYFARAKILLTALKNKTTEEI